MSRFINKAYNMFFKKMIKLVGLTFLVLGLLGCGSDMKEQERDSSGRGDNNNSIQWNNTESSDSKEEPKEKVYSITADSGRYNLQAKPGFAAVLCKQTKYAEGVKRASVLLPDIEAWSDGLFARKGFRISNEGEYYYVYKSVGVPDEEALDCVRKYHELLANYSVTVTTDASYSDWTDYTEWLGGDYKGTQSITPNSMKAYDDYFDMSFVYMDSFLDTSYLIYCPKEISFVDYGDRYDGAKVQNPEWVNVYTNETMPKYGQTKTGLDYFEITGWSQDSGDYIEIDLHPELYKKGDVFDLEYFAKQADAGTGKLCSIVVNSKTITCEDILCMWMPDKNNKERFKSVSVEILEKSDTVTAITYCIELNGDLGDDFTLQGVFAIQTGEEHAVDTEQKDSNPGSNEISNGKNRCTSCSGTGKSYINCTRCMSRGKIDCRDCYNGNVDCTKCGGSGKIWDSLNGREVYCSYCTLGKVSCSKCYGAGQVNCDNCGGDGKVEQNCPVCGGTGKW